MIDPEMCVHPHFYHILHFKAFLQSQLRVYGTVVFIVGTFVNIGVVMLIQYDSSMERHGFNVLMASSCVVGIDPSF
jgi:hypothetical protein